MGVPRNYLKVTDLTFYYPYDLQSDVDVGDTENGQPDAVEMLYTNDNVDEYGTWPSTDTDEYDVAVGEMDTRQRFTRTLRALIPSAFRTVLSTKAGEIIRLRDYKLGYDWSYRM